MAGAFGEFLTACGVVEFSRVLPQKAHCASILFQLGRSGI
jgi:hypothetical protein